MIVPESAGGLELGMTELMAVLQEQGSSLAAVPLWEHQLAAATLAHHGSLALQPLVDGAVAGTNFLTISLASSLAPQGATLSGSAEGNGLRLNGHVAAVLFGAQATHALLAAEVQGMARLVLVDLAESGIRRTPGVSQHHIEAADLAFDDVAVGLDALLAGPAMNWLEPRAIACLAALQLGVSVQQLSRAVQYVSERKQFNRPIASFQLVAGQMADGHIAIESLRTSLWQLVYRLDNGMGALPQGWATRLLACEAGHKVGHMAQHVHGGMGVDITFPIHRFLFWSRVLGVVLGGAERNLAKLGDWLADHDSLGWKYDLTEDKAV
jgi:alkylation response protein AidB-like acyl-CoA dehydrogenase